MKFVTDPVYGIADLFSGIISQVINIVGYPVFNREMNAKYQLNNIFQSWRNIFRINKHVMLNCCKLSDKQLPNS